MEFSSHISENQTSDLSGELAYIVEMSSIFTIDGGLYACFCRKLCVHVGTSVSQSVSGKVGVCMVGGEYT